MEQTENPNKQELKNSKVDPLDVVIHKNGFTASQLISFLMENYPYVVLEKHMVNLSTKDILLGQDIIQFGGFDTHGNFYNCVRFGMNTQRDVHNFPKQFMLALKNREQRMPDLIEDKKI